jgi:predicted Rdx family selenoprotein
MSKKHWLSRLVELYSIDLAYAARKQKVGTLDAEIKIFETSILDTIRAKLPEEVNAMDIWDRRKDSGMPVSDAIMQADAYNECLKAVKEALLGEK